MDGYTFFSHLILDRGTDCSKIAETESYNVNSLAVAITVNGIDLSVSDFNKVMEDWADRVEESVLKKHSLNNFKYAVKEATKEKFYQLINTVDWEE